MKNRGKSVVRLVLLLSLCMFLVANMAWAQSVDQNEFGNYGNNNVSKIVLPEVTGGWFDSVDYFPGEDSDGNEITTKIGNYEVAGRLLVANHQTIYLQKTYGAGCDMGSWTEGQNDFNYSTEEHILPGGHDNFIPVATVTIVNAYPAELGSMDPSFIKVSPDGDKIALGMGWGQPLLIIDVSALDTDSPPLLNGSDGLTPISGVKEWTSSSVQYYDAEWVDNDRLAMNADYGWDPDEQTGTGSQVDILDVTDESNTRVTVIGNIGVGNTGGASADVTIDLEGNIITGNGYDYGDDSHTGELMMFSIDDWENAYDSGIALDYQGDEGHLLANNVLSAAQLGVDKDNNLHVGGGSWLGTVGDELGYAAIIHADVLDNVMYNEGGPVDENDSTQYRELRPDPNGDDSATSPVLYNPWSEGLSVVWNPNGGLSGAGTDLWSIGVRPIMTTYYGANAPDYDSDGIPDGSDNAYKTSNPDQKDTDGDGYGNAADADFNNDGVVSASDFLNFKQNYGASDSDADMDGNGKVGASDYILFKKQYNKNEPYY